MKYLILCLFLFTACASPPSEKTRIAILTPVTHPSLEQMERGFKEVMQENGEFVFDVYNGQGNKTLIRSEIEEIIRKKYALIFTIGTLTSEMTTEVLTKKRIDTPVVFTAVNDPVGFHIIASEASSGNMATGVKELLDFKTELTHLLTYKPSVKKLLLVYNPTESGLEKDQKELARLTQELGIELITVEIFHTNELISKVPPFMPKADALIILKDNSVITGLELLVKLCNQYHIPLIASDLDSPDKGAAFGFGVHEAEFGREAAKKALFILHEGLKPSEIPTTPITSFSLRINQKAAALQGVDHVFHP